jgi:2-dehydro-3-deoxyphosphooctonate aldolase (KDO 8-P synthase)
LRAGRCAERSPLRGLLGREGGSMKLGDFEVGLDRPFFLIAGTCVVESEPMAIDTAGRLKEMTHKLGIPFIYKSSYDKANRSSGKSFRGPGMDEGLRILSEVRRQIGVPVLTDVHTEDEVPTVAAVVDVLQTPAFLCRQTDFIRACAVSGKPVNIKKGQFLAPGDMKNVIDKARDAAREAGLSEDRFMACERGASFGYNNLVSDMRSLAIMRETRAPVVFDATHSVQLPGGAPPAVGSASSCRCWRVRRWRWAWRACSWRRTPIRRMPRATDRMPCRCIAWRRCWPRWSNWIARPRRTASWRTTSIEGCGQLRQQRPSRAEDSCLKPM